MQVLRFDARKLALGHGHGERGFVRDGFERVRERQVPVGLQAYQEVEAPLWVDGGGGEDGVCDVDDGRVPPGVVAGFGEAELVEDDDALELA